MAPTSCFKLAGVDVETGDARVPADRGDEGFGFLFLEAFPTARRGYACAVRPGSRDIRARPDHRTGDRPEEIGAEHVQGLTEPPHESGDEGIGTRAGCLMERVVSASLRPALPCGRMPARPTRRPRSDRGDQPTASRPGAESCSQNGGLHDHPTQAALPGCSCGSQPGDAVIWDGIGAGSLRLIQARMAANGSC